MPKPRITGDLVVHRAVYEREPDRTAQALDRAGARVAASSSGESLADRTELELTLRPEDGLRVATDTATLVIDGTVKVGGTLATPELDGSLSMREGGTVRVSRALVRLQGGRIELRGFPARPPEIEIQGVTQVTGVRIDVGLSGSLDDVRMNLSSSNRSDLSQGDLATLILTGRTTSEAAADSGAIVVEEVAAALGQVARSPARGRRDDRRVARRVADRRRHESIAAAQHWCAAQQPPLRDLFTQPRSTRPFAGSSTFGQAAISASARIANDDGSEAIEVSHRFGFNAWSRKYLPARAKEARLQIGDVVISGAPPGTEAELRKQLKLKRGDTFDYFRR